MASRTHVPDTIATFEVDARVKLGQGSFGTVYIGRDTDTNQEVAIKSIEPPVALRGTDFVKCIENELELLGSIHHPNIVRLLHHERRGSCVYMILELCMSDLQKFAAENELPEQLKLQFRTSFVSSSQTSSLQRHNTS